MIFSIDISIERYINENFFFSSIEKSIEKKKNG